MVHTENGKEFLIIQFKEDRGVQFKETFKISTTIVKRSGKSAIETPIPGSPSSQWVNPTLKKRHNALEAETLEL